LGARYLPENTVTYIIFYFPQYDVFGLEILLIVYFFQFSETNMKQFLFSLLRVKDLYMVAAILSHPQEALKP
jgi:hypothetical protein